MVATFIAWLVFGGENIGDRRMIEPCAFLFIYIFFNSIFK